MGVQKPGPYNDAARMLRQAANKLVQMADLDANVTYDTAEKTRQAIAKLRGEAETLVDAALVRFV